MPRLRVSLIHPLQAEKYKQKKLQYLMEYNNTHTTYRNKEKLPVCGQETIS